MSIIVYNARSMTGRVKKDVVAEAKADKLFLEQAGFTVLCPVEKEEVPATDQVLISSRKAMEDYWPKDKRMIEECDVLFDLTPERKSEGVAHELGYARYFLYRPVIRVYREGKLPVASSVAYFEDDYVTDSLVDAVEYTLRMHGTRWKRIKWRFNLYARCLPKMVKIWFSSWK